MVSLLRRMVRGRASFWEVGTQEMQEVLSPDDERWGVYAVWFPRMVHTAEDLAFKFPPCPSRVEKEIRRNADLAKAQANKALQLTARQHASQVTSFLQLEC